MTKPPSNFELDPKTPFSEYYLRKKKQLELNAILRNKKQETLDLQLRTIQQCDPVRERNKA